MNFASDNAAGIAPQILAAISRANAGAALAYGQDAWTRKAYATQTAMLATARSFEQVEAAGLAFHIPYYDYDFRDNAARQGRTVRVNRCSFGDGTLEVLKVDLVRGRYFGEQDDALGNRPVIINEHLRKALFGPEDPIGKKIEMTAWGTEVIVVGVMSDFRKNGEFSETGNVMLKRMSYSYAETAEDISGHWPHRQLMIRLRPGTTLAQEERLIRRLQDIARDWSFEVTTLEERRAKWLKDNWVKRIALVVIGLLVMMMVCLGLMGVLWQNVTRRTEELGLRRALGATAGGIRGLVLGELMTLTSVAVVVGAVIYVQVPLLQFFPEITFGVYAVSFLASVLAIYLIVALCGLYPSWLATRIQPATALQYE